MHPEELLSAVQGGDRAGTQTPFLFPRDVPTLVHPRYQKVSKVFSGFQSLRIASGNCRRKRELATSSSGPTLESAQLSTQQRQKQLGVTGCLLCFNGLTLSGHN